MQQTTASLDMHEKHNDEEDLCDRNCQRDDEIEGTEIYVANSPSEREQEK